MYKREGWIAVAFGVALFFAPPSRATTLTTTCFNGTSCWTTSEFISGPHTELNFGTINNQNYPSGITLDAIGNSSIGFAFTGPASGSQELKGATGGGANSLSAGYIDIATPASGENAFLLALSSTGTITVTLSDGSYLSGSSGLFGFSVSHLITSIDVTTTGSSVLVNDFFYATSSLQQDSGGGNTNSAPETATLLLTSSGLLILFGTRRKLIQRQIA